MRNKPMLVFIAMGSLFCLPAFAQTGNELSRTVTEKLKAYTAEHITEKAYLHFDKPYYAAGDTIYFKAYVTQGDKHELSTLSGVLHVDLINTVNEIDRSIKLQMINGVACGDFALPDSLPGGNYRIRAYTRWMRNEGAGAFFDKVIPIGSLLNNKVPESGTYPKTTLKGKPDIQFFPEGGSLVCGIMSKVAFNAIGADGLGMAVKGIITDNTGEEITAFTAAHLGMGSFDLRPEPGKTYSAKITYADGSQDSLNLPAAVNSGVVLKIDNSRGDKAALQIISNKTYFAANHGKDINLLVYTSGFTNSVNIRLDSAILNLALLKRHLYTGITTVTLFSSTGEPLSERLLFVQNPDQLKLAVNTDKTAYHKREKVHLNIHALNRADSAVTGYFSVAVTDESKVPVDENTETTILTSLLLTSDLKGYVEQPNYYFNNITAKTQSNLDLVMLTHGYRRFEWKKLLNNDYPPIAYQPETGLQISGAVKSPFGKRVVNGKVDLISLKNGPVISSTTDEKGLFRFANLSFIDTGHFMLSAVNAKNKNNTIITYFKDSPPAADTIKTLQTPADKEMLVYLDSDEKQQEELNKIGIGKGRMLKEVKIRGFKPDNNYRTESLAGAGGADQVMHADEIERIQGNLVTSLNGRLRGVIFLGRPGQQTPILTINAPLKIPMLVVVDGVKGGDFNTFTANQVETVEVLKYASASIYGSDGAGGVLVITTKQGGGLDPKDIASIGVLPISPIGYYKAREFYSPKYEHPDYNLNRRDLRSTIYWKPEIQTDKDGNAFFEYYNADGTGDYRVVIEGIDDQGNLGRQVYRYKVE